MGKDGNWGNCKSCGRRVIWVKTKAGRNMPVDPELITYQKKTGGKEKIVTPGGDVVSAERVKDGSPEASGVGYISHFATCPLAGLHRMKK